LPRLQKLPPRNKMLTSGLEVEILFQFSGLRGCADFGTKYKFGRGLLPVCALVGAAGAPFSRFYLKQKQHHKKRKKICKDAIL